MGLTELLASAATRRVHVLVAEAPGGLVPRVALERALVSRGWTTASSPADADVLAVCGTPGEALAARFDAVYDELPGPRARADISGPHDVVSALDSARDRLVDLTGQVTDARARVPPDQSTEHGDVDHGDMETAPGGIPLAEGAPDRDGLEMDVLHLPLGPVLPHWPAGLVVRCIVHGDVVAGVEVEQLDEPGASEDPGTAVEAARRLDAVAAVLSRAGWDRGAVAARRARDRCLAADPAAATTVAELRRRLSGARLLRWMLRGFGTVDPATVPGDLRQTLAGDVHDRLLHLVDDATRLLDGTTGTAPYDARELLPHVLPGLELASVRLVVASLGPFVARFREEARA
jgi:hypothetical protein